jgi:predicted membrane chloride channel (bestrophin family)
LSRLAITMAPITKGKGCLSSMMLLCIFVCLLFESSTSSSSSSFEKDASLWAPSSMYPSIPTIQAVSYQNVSSTITTSSRPSLWKNSKGTKLRHSRDNIDSFLSDLCKLDSIFGRAPILTKSHSKRDSSYTKSWTDADWELHQIKSLRRYAKHMRSWCTSPTFISVLPAVLASLLWTLCCIGAVRYQLVKDFVQQAPFLHSISSFTSPISILLALKTNRSLDRLFEARSVWGKMIRVSTSLAGMTVNYLSPIDPELGLLMGRYLAAFGWCMKGKLRGEDDSLVLRTLLPSSEMAWIESCNSGSGGVIDSPSVIIFRLRSIVANITNDAESRLSIAATQIIEERLGELETSVGICKKIVASPIPPTFTRMTSRVLCLFLCCLPLALVSSGISPIAIVVVVTLLSYIFVGIDEIGVELEYPFPLLPMFSLATTLKSGVGNQFKMMKEVTR